MRIRTVGAQAIGHLLRVTLRPQAARFERDLERPAVAQRRLLREIVTELARTGYGAHFGVRPDDDYNEFRAKLPVVTYDALAPWIDRQMRGEGRTLVAAPVRFYEKTSGSSGPAKYIPYTAALARSFTRMFRVWLYDLLAHGPPLETGMTWISISPARGPHEATPRGVRIGLGSDREYLAGWLRTVLDPFLVLPPEVGGLRDPDAFRHIAALYLLAEDPEVVSVWNPSFLTVLLSHISAHRAELRRDWAAGRAVREGIEFRVARAAAERLEVLGREPLEWRALLPGLKLISCWADENARSGAAHLRRLFPGTMLQAKGLLATEAPMTFPLIRAGGFVPVIQDVFFEFEDESGRSHLLEELDAGRAYAVLLTQRGGLYRYRIGDRVRVSHFYRRTPCLAFIGREGSVCDLVGEKLHETFVAAALRGLPLQGSRFQTLVPLQPPDHPCHYVLLVDRLEASPRTIAEELDSILQGAHRYREARRLGQLGPPRVHVAADAEDLVFRYFTANGMRLGDIKHRYLLAQSVAGSSLAAELR